jgi:trk system potassium uptake protein
MKVIVVGCGLQGTDLAQTLQRCGHQVTAIDPDPNNLKRLGAKFEGCTLCGVAFDRKVLLDAGIEQADGLAAMTNSDDANIVTALLARNIFHVPQVVARLYDPRQRDIYRRLGLQTISPVEIGTSHIVNLLVYRQLETLMAFGSGELVLVQSDVPMLLVGRTVSELSAPGEIVVNTVIRKNHAFLPSSGSVFQKGDTVSLVVASSSMERLHQLFGLM